MLKTIKGIKGLENTRQELMLPQMWVRWRRKGSNALGKDIYRGEVLESSIS